MRMLAMMQILQLMDNLLILWGVCLLCSVALHHFGNLLGFLSGCNCNTHVLEPYDYAGGGSHRIAIQMYSSTLHSTSQQLESSGVHECNLCSVAVL